MSDYITLFVCLNVLALLLNELSKHILAFFGNRLCMNLIK